MARLALAAVVGVVVGYVSGNPYYGLQAFSLVYGVTGFLDPNKKVSGPRLNDLRAPSASYGSPIPYLEGAPRVAGVFFWSSEKREIARTTTVGGKGGPGVDSTQYTYEIDCLIGLAINECDAISRVWSNGRLVWSNSSDADAETILVSSDIPDWRDIRFYSGAEDQLPDPTYEAAVGIENAPAYRGRTTVFIEGLNLAGSGQLPLLTFEVLSEADYVGTVTDFADIPITTLTYPAVVGQGSSPFSAAGFRVHIGQWDANYSNSNVNVYDVAADGTVTLADTYTATANEPSGHGQTDVAGMMSGGGLLGGGPFDQRMLYWEELEPDALHTVYSFQLPTIGDWLGGAQVRFCMLGDVVVFGSTNFGTNKLYRFSKADALGVASPLATVSLSPYTNVDALATDGTLLYALIYTSRIIRVYDVATLTLQTTLSDPADPSHLGLYPGEANAAIVVDEEGDLYLFCGNPPYNIYRWDGSVWHTDFAGVVTGIAGGSNDNAQYGVSAGIVFQMAWDGASHQRVNAYIRGTVASEVMLDQVVRRLCLRTGQLLDADIDVTQLASIQVRAMALTQVAPIRQALDMLSGAYLFEFVENAKLKAVLRGGSAVMTIPFEDLGASADASGSDPLPKKRGNEMEVPARVSIKFANVLNDFQDGLETGDRLTTESQSHTVIEIPLGFTPAEAKKLADVQTMDLVTSLISIGPIALTQNYARLEPTDVVLIVDEDGSTYRVRIVKGSVAGGIYTLDLVLDDATVVNSVATTDSDYVSSTLLRALATTRLVLMDIPILRDVDDSPGSYAAFDASGRWPGTELSRSLDDTSYAVLLTSATTATIGDTSSTLGDFTGGNVFDEVNSLTVDVDDHELSSATRDDLLTGTTNALLVGSEIIQFRTATLQSAGVYVLTGLLRGRRGTEWAMSSHVASERVVLLETATLRRLTDEVADIDQPYYYKAVTFGKSAGGTSSQIFTDTGVSLMPFAPVDLRVDRTGANLAVTWHRRSRLSSRFLAITDPTLGEVVESYAVEVHSGVTLITSATVTTPSYSDASLIAGRTVTVSQNSAYVGAGYSATIGL